MGPVETAIRRLFTPPVTLRTCGQRRPFILRGFDRDGIVLELGQKRARTPLGWDCLEGIPAFLRGRGWIRAGGAHNVAGEPGTLDEYLKGCIKRDTARWLAVVLAQAGIIETNPGPPLQLRLR